MNKEVKPLEEEKEEMRTETEKVIHVISLGAGVQSSAMALMAAHGELTPMPTVAIFADTQREPDHVYLWLEKLRELLPFPVVTTTAGDLGADFLAALRGESRCGQPPFFTDKQGESGMLWRQCTKDYKLNPLRRETRKLMEDAGAKHVVQWIGISWDEWHRAGRESGVKYITNRYPLMEKRLTREQCLMWMKEHKYPLPPKSACYFCPYTSDARWRDLKINHPEEFERAVRYDNALRSNHDKEAANIQGSVYVHRSLKPLSEVDFSTPEDKGQLSMFSADCEGMCGV